MFMAALQTVAALSSGCLYAPALVRYSQVQALKPFAEAKGELPSLSPGHTRIFVYRPQRVVGMYGSAVVIVNGKWMGDAAHPSDNTNLLLPGAVFVVDSPADVTRVWWSQGGKGEEKDKALTLRAAETRTWYLRWGMAPTHGFLEVTPEDQAVGEIEPLRFSGYVKLEPH